MTTRQPELPSAKLDARFERVLKTVEWVEMAVQIRLEPEQRAHVVRELGEMDIPEVVINCAAYILAAGFLEVYGRLDMAQWRKAIEEVPHQIGKLKKFYRQGFSVGQQSLWRAIRMGSYNEELKNILEETES